MTGRRLLGESLAVGLGWSAAVLPFLGSMLAAPTTRFWGSGGADVLGLLWTLWHVGWSLVHGEGLGIHTDLVQFPEGGSLWPATPLEAVALAPLTLWWGAVASFNLLQVAHVGLAGGAAYALVRRATGSIAAALATSPMVALSPVLLCSAHNGNAEVAQMYWLPLAGLAAWRGSTWGVALAGLLVAAATVGNVYVGVSAGIFTLGLLVARDAGWLRRAAVMVAVAAVVAGPVMLVAAAASTQGAAMVTRSTDAVFHMRLMEGAATLKGFVVPGPVQGLDPGGQPTPWLNGWAPGTMALVLAGLATTRAVRSGAGRLELGLLGTSLFSALMAMGPVLKPLRAPLAVGGRYVPLPYVLLDLVPPFDMLVELWRFAMVIPVALALVVGHLLARARPRWTVGAGVALLAEALLLNPGPSVWTVNAVPDEPMADLAARVEQDPGPVLHFPVRQYQWPLYWQTLHHQPVGNSTETAADPVIFDLVVGREWTLAELADTARRRGYRWLVLHTRDELETVQPVGRLGDLLEGAGRVTWAGGNLLLCDLAAPGAWPVQPVDARIVVPGEAP